MNRGEWVTIGRITAVQGVNGAIRVYPQSDSPGRFSALSSCYIRHIDGRITECTVESAREQKGVFVLKVAGVTDRNMAEKLRYCELVVPRAAVGPLPEGSYYVFDIIGMIAVSPSGETYGTVTDVISNPANDIYVLQRPGKPDSLIPAIKQVVKEIDVAAKRMVIAPWPGMMDDEEVLDT